jgi:hypothetical protein
MRSMLTFIALVACDPNLTAPEPQRGPPLDLDCTLFAPASPFRCTVTGATPGQTVYLAGGTPGRTCPPALGGACLQLRAPVVLGAAVADSAGVATFLRTLPATVPQGLTLAAQAAVLGPAAVSPAHQGTVYPALWLDGGAGQAEACLLAGDGLPRCFGANPATPPPGVHFTALDYGQAFTACGVEAGTGEIVCWGGTSSVHTGIPTGPFVDVDLGNDHACATAATGGVTCWGWSCSSWVPPGWTTVNLSATVDGTCGLDAAGAMSCYGLACSSYRFPATPGTFTDVAVSSGGVTGLRADGNLQFFGRVGLPTPNPGSPPAGTFTHVAAGWSAACALDAAGAPTCWGPFTSGWTLPPGPFERLIVHNEGACGWSARGPAQCWGAWQSSPAPVDLPPSL